MIVRILLVGLGGFVGSILRYLVQISVQQRISSLFPLGTLMVNLIGCLIIGIIFGCIEKGNLLTPNLRLLLAVGFCGGFTTFSSFAYESLQLMKSSSFVYMAAYIGISVFLGILLTYLGWIIIRSV